MQNNKGYGYGLGVRTFVDKAASGATVLVDHDRMLLAFCAHHMLNPQERIYQPRLRNLLYTCIDR